MKSIGIFIFTLLSLFTIVNSTILLTQPAKNPFENNTLQYWYSNFGEIHYNKPALYDLDVKNLTFCGDEEEQSKLKHYSTPTYVVVNGNRGTCSYPARALKAQELGARGIIYGSSDINYALSGRVVLSDDGHGRKVHIASLFISPQEFEKLLSLKNIKIKTNFPLVQHQKSSVTLFLSAAYRKIFIFLRDFQPYYQKIKEYINLNVVYYTFACEFCDQQQCLLHKTCCSLDFENFKPNVGRYIVKQQFREFNLFKYCQKNQCLDKWFEYMNKFDEYCDNNWIESEKCSTDIISNELGIQKNMNLGDDSNNMMDWRRTQTKTGIFWYPDLSVNGFRHQESLTAKNSFEMICESLKSPPQQCTGKKQETPKSNMTGLIIGLVITGILLLALGVICYRRIVKRQITNDMSSRVNQLVAKYASRVSQQKKKRKDKLMEKITEQI